MRSRTARPAALSRSLRVGVVLTLALAVLAAVPATLFHSPSGRAATPPPTPVPPSGSPSPFPTALHTPPATTQPPKLSSPSAILADLDSGQVLFAKKASVRRPIASITKLMTALVVLDTSSPDEQVIVSRRAAGIRGSQLGLVIGERISVRQLLYALLMQSSNDAAIALAEHVAGSVPAFVERMNQKAAELALRRTRFQDPAGLEDRGYSTARDLAEITRAAFEQPLFARIARTKFHRIPAPKGKARRIQNRNILLWLYPGAIGGKTGFTTPAGHCLMAMADRNDVRLVVVALGSGGDDAEGVFSDGAALLNFGYEAFDRASLSTGGQAVGSVTVEGQRVDAVAAGALVRFVRKDQLPLVVRAFLPDTGLFLPVVEGQRVGEVVIRVAGKRVGTIEAVAARAVFHPPPRSVRTPSPVGAGSVAGVLRLLTALLRSLLDAFL